MCHKTKGFVLFFKAFQALYPHILTFTSELQVVRYDKQFVSRRFRGYYQTPYFAQSLRRFFKDVNVVNAS